MELIKAAKISCDGVLEANPVMLRLDACTCTGNCDGGTAS